MNRQRTPGQRRIAVEIRKPDVARLSRPHQIFESTKGLFDRGVLVGRMSLVEIHVVQTQANETLLDRVQDVLAGQSRSQGAVPHAAHHLGGYHHLLAWK